MAGTVIAVSLVKTKRAVLEVDLHYGNLAEGVARARVIDIPAELIPALGTDISVVDALPAGGAQDAWVAWDTQLWIWAVGPRAGWAAIATLTMTRYG